jgi:hypothetical protein
MTEYDSNKRLKAAMDYAMYVGFVEQVADLREQEPDIDLICVLAVFKNRAVEAGKERDRLDAINPRRR